MENHLWTLNPLIISFTLTFPGHRNIQNILEALSKIAFMIRPLWLLLSSFAASFSSSVQPHADVGRASCICGPPQPPPQYSEYEPQRRVLKKILTLHVVARKSFATYPKAAARTYQVAVITKAKADLLLWNKGVQTLDMQWFLEPVFNSTTENVFLRIAVWIMA